jgi:hypothetical protein
MNPIELTAKQLRRAATLKEQIEKLQKELASILNLQAQVAAKSTKAGRKRRKARPVAVKSPVLAAEPPKKKFTMSEAAKAAISKKAKARWAKIKAAKQQK